LLRYTPAVRVFLRFLAIIVVFAVAIWLIHRARKIIER
jgi:hypothetical protein